MKALLFLLALAAFANCLQKLTPRNPNNASNSELFKPFPHIVWVYEHLGLDNSTYLWTKFCLNNMLHYSKLSGWNVRFLTNQNYTEWLSPESLLRLKEIQKFQDGNRQQLSEVLRAFLLYDHGGVWIDANSFFLGELTWIDQLYQEPYIYNRFFPNPEIVTFTKNYIFSGNKTAVKHHTLDTQVYLHPGVQSTFMIARPQATFLKDVLLSIEYSISIRKREMDRQAMQKGIKFDKEANGFYFFSNYQYQLVIQGKQKQLNKISTSPIKYAVQYYRMWSMDQDLVNLLIHEHEDTGISKSMFFRFSLDELENILEWQLRPTFVKLTRQMVRQANSVLLEVNKSECSMNLTEVKSSSIFYQTMVNITSSFHEIDLVKDSLSFFEKQDYSVCSTTLNNIKDLSMGENTIIFSIFGCLFTVLLSNLVQRYKIAKKLDKQEDEEEAEEEE